MTFDTRAAIAIHGPGGAQSSLLGGGGEVTNLVAFPANAAQSAAIGGALTSEQVVYVVPGLSAFSQAGAQQDAVPSSGQIGTITAIRLATMGVALGANLANLTLSWFLRRAGAVIGGGAFAGWGLAANPAIAAYSQAVVPFLATNTALVAPQGQVLTAANALMPIQAGDIVTMSMVAAAAITMPFVSAYTDVI